MKRLLTLASFALVLSFVLGVSDDPELVELSIGSRMDLEGESIQGKVKRCTIATSLGDVEEFFPLNKSPGTSVGNENVCKFQLRNVELDDAGVWILETITDEDEIIEKKFAVTISHGVQAMPSTRIYANKGQWVTVWLDGNDTDVTECKLKATMEPEVRDLMNGSIGNFSRYRGCGVRMPADKKYEQQWELTRKIGNYLIEESIFHLYVSNEDEHDQRVIKVLWNLGDEETLEIEESDVILCQFTRPDGSVTEIQSGRCRHTVGAVTDFHRGIWRVSYAKKGKMELSRAEIHVETWDTAALTATQHPGRGQEINLLCRAGAKVLKFCSFIRPDKYIINLPVGVGNDNYTYFGDGFTNDLSSRHYADCGLTIRQPSEVDFGLWYCQMGVPKPSGETVIRGTVIELVKNRAERTLKISRPRVIVKRGDPFKIRCTVNGVLNYCWLRSPNGTVYSVSPEADSRSLKYDGRGFAMGDCGAIVNSANTSDDGSWSCHLGVSGSTEVEDNVSVQVTDSYLIPVSRNVYSNGMPKLSFFTFSREESTVKYCRWVRPDGHGINEDDKWRFENDEGMHTCELTILEVKPEDFGQWTCVAMLTGSVGTEQSATVQLKSANYELGTTTIISIILGSMLLLVTIVGSSFAAIYIYKRQMFHGSIKSPPPYDPEDYETPRIMKTCSDKPSLNADSRY